MSGNKVGGGFEGDSQHRRQFDPRPPTSMFVALLTPVGAATTCLIIPPVASSGQHVQRRLQDRTVA